MGNSQRQIQANAQRRREEEEKRQNEDKEKREDKQRRHKELMETMNVGFGRLEGTMKAGFGHLGSRLDKVMTKLGIEEEEKSEQVGESLPVAGIQDPQVSSIQVKADSTGKSDPTLKAEVNLL